MKQGDDWNAFVSLLLTYQYTEKRVPFTQGLSDLLYRHTQGIQDLVVKLIAIAQMEAIASGEEELSLTLVDRVATEHLSVLAPACRKLAGNAREDDPALWDLEPVKFDKYVNELHARLHMQAVKQRKRAVSAASHAETAMAVAASLVTAQAASIGVAEELAANAVEKAPARTASEHVVSILQAATVKGPKPTRSEKRKAEVDREFEKLDDDDLRKIVYLASRRGESAEAALDAKGFICHPLEELTV